MHRNRFREGQIGGKGKRDGSETKNPSRTVRPPRAETWQCTQSLNHSLNCSTRKREKRREETGNTQKNGTHRPTTEIHSDIAAPSTSYQHGPNHRTLPPESQGQGQTSATTTQDNPPAHPLTRAIPPSRTAKARTTLATNTKQGVPRARMPHQSSYCSCILSCVVFVFGCPEAAGRPHATNTTLPLLWQ